MKLKKAATTAALLAATMAVGTTTALVAAPTAAASTCWSLWTVTWPTAGAYAEPTTSSHLIDTLHSGQNAISFLGEPVPGWLRLAQPTPGYVRKQALRYEYTFCD